MNDALLPALLAGALLAPAPAFADEPVVTLDYTHLADAYEARAQADVWKRWADDYSREMRSSMGTMFGARLGSQKVVKGAPYSAEVLTETSQSLADGNVISHKTQGSIYRDGEGRVRQEMPGDGRQPAVFITDPVAKTHAILTPGSKRAIVTRSRSEASAPLDKRKEVIVINGRELRFEDGKLFVDGKESPGGKTEIAIGAKTLRFDNGKVTIDGKELGAERGDKSKIDRIVVKTIDSSEAPDGTEREEVRVQVLRGGPEWAPLAPLPPQPPAPPGNLGAPLAPLPPMPGVQTFRFESTSSLGKGVTTNLGMKEFDGVRAEGKSTVWTIPAGEIGNRNPINVTSENWYSPDLQVTVYSRYNDPRTGESVYRLAGIRRGEPSADLFRVPEGYEVKKRTRDR